jgi:uncharacterized protein
VSTFFFFTFFSRFFSLFLQGTRDALADLSLLKPICSELGEQATLVIVVEADHPFHVPKRSSRSASDTMKQMAGAVAY